MKKINITQEKDTYDITYEFENKEWKKIIDKEEKKLLKNVRIDGFRPGSQAAKASAKKLVDTKNIFNDALEPASKIAIREIVEGEEFNEINDKLANLPPSLEVLKISNENLELVFKFKKVPEVKIDDWKKIKVLSKLVVAKKEDIKEEISKLLDKEMVLEPKENKKIEKNDTATFDFKGFLEGVPFENGEAKNFELEIGSKQFIPGFEDKMIGLKLGEEATIELEFPKEYHEAKLAGQPVKFEIKINDIKSKVAPKLTDDFVKELKIESVTTISELEKYLENNINDKNKSKYDKDIENEVVDELIKLTTLSYEEEGLYEAEKNQLLERNKKQFEQYGMEFEQFLKITGMTEEKFIEQASLEARKLFIYKMAMDQIIKEEKLQLSDKEFDEEMVNISKEWDKSIKEVKEILGKNIEFVKKDLLRLKKIRNIIKELTK